jgi:hypothetical protein
VADSYRLQVLKKLTQHLANITPTSGYQHNLGPTTEYPYGSVFRGRAIFGQDDPVPMVSILEAPRSDVGSFAGENRSQRKEDWSLLIQGWAIDDKENPTDPVYALLDEVERHLFRLTATKEKTGSPLYPDEYLLGKTVVGVTISPGIVQPARENLSSKAFFYLPITVQLVRPLQ